MATYKHTLFASVGTCKAFCDGPPQTRRRRYGILPWRRSTASVNTALRAIPNTPPVEYTPTDDDAPAVNALQKLAEVSESNLASTTGRRSDGVEYHNNDRPDGVKKAIGGSERRIISSIVGAASNVIQDVTAGYADQKYKYMAIQSNNWGIAYGVRNHW